MVQSVLRNPKGAIVFGHTTLIAQALPERELRPFSVNTVREPELILRQCCVQNTHVEALYRVKLARLAPSTSGVTNDTNTSATRSTFVVYMWHSVFGHVVHGAPFI